MRNTSIFIARTMACLMAGLVLLQSWAGAWSGDTARAQSIVATGQSFVTPRLLPGKVMPDGGRLAGLRLSMEPGWKTYWRSPGETGIPPHFDWSRSVNVRDIVMHWPRPGMFESFGMWTAGYGDVVLFPLEVRPLDPSEPMVLALSADLGVCKDICVLENVQTALEIGTDDPPIGARQIRSAMRRVPVVATPDTVVVHGCRFAGAGRDRQMIADLGFVEALSHPKVLIEHLDGAWIKYTKQSNVEGGVRVAVDFVLPEGQSWIDRSAFRMTVLADEGAYDIQGCKAG